MWCGVVWCGVVGGGGGGAIDSGLTQPNKLHIRGQWAALKAFHPGEENLI